MSDNGNSRSIWDGSLRWRPDSATAWLDDREDGLRLRRLVEGGRPLVLIGRYSDANGLSGARYAASDLVGAAAELTIKSGWDVSDVLPPEEFMAQALFNSTNRVRNSDPSGSKFDNRFCLIDIRSHGLVLSLSTGTGRKLASDLEQPHLQWLRRILRDEDLQAAGLAAKRQDRFGRHDAQVGMLREEARAVSARRPLWLFNGTTGLWDLTNNEDLIVIFHAHSAKKEAEEFAASRARGQRKWTGGEMLNGSVSYGLPRPCPPGTFHWKDRRSKRSFMVIDSPQFYPHQTEVERPLPDVRDEQGTRVDQAEIVREFLAHFGRPGWGFEQAADFLGSRRFSTEGLRQRVEHGPTAWFVAAPEEEDYYEWASTVTRSILDNLEMYRTGVLRRGVGPGQEAIVIQNVWPAAGYWASEADFDRIEKFLASNSRSKKYYSWSWSGMPLTVNGRKARVIAPIVMERHRDEGAMPAGGLRWRVDIQDSGDDDLTRELCPTIPDSVLTSMIIDGVVRAEGVPLVRFVRRNEETSEAAQLERQIAATEQAQHALAINQERDFEDLHARDAAGNFRMGEATRERFLAHFERDEQRLRGLTRELETLRKQATALKQAEPSGAKIAAIQAVLNGIKNPRTNEYREELRATIEDLKLQVSAFEVDGYRGARCDLSAKFVVDTSTGPHFVPLAAQFDVGRASTVPAEMNSLIDRMRRGEVIKGRDKRLALSAGTALGIPDGRFYARSITDPTLMRMTMAIVHPPRVEATAEEAPTFENDPRMVTDFGNVAALVDRIRWIGQINGTWCWLRKDRGPLATRAAVAAVTDAGASRIFSSAALLAFRRSLTKAGELDEWQFESGKDPVPALCRRCGSRSRAQMLLREVTGLLCLECRHDSAGVRWPSRYDPYLAQPDLWREAGIRLELADNYQGGSRAIAEAIVYSTRALRLQARDLDDQGKQRVAMLYADRSHSVHDIEVATGLCDTEILRIADELGVPRRRPRYQRHAAGRLAIDLTPGDEERVLQAYSDRAQPLSSISREFDMSAREILSLVDRRGIARRRRRRGIPCGPSTLPPGEQEHTSESSAEDSESGTRNDQIPERHAN